MAARSFENGATDPIIWLNGESMRASAAYVSPFDHGLLTGDGVFETLAVYERRPFAISRHYERLLQSAAALDLNVPTMEALQEAMRLVVESNGLQSARIRITITGGVGPLGSGKGDTPDSALVAASQLPNHAATGQLVVVPYTRNEGGALAGVKSTSYGENVRALAYAQQHGGNEAIFGNVAGNLCEGTGSNIFVVLDGQLVTPTLSSGCLAGVTRAIVLDLCRELTVSVEERDVPLSDLNRAQEAFLTSSLREVQPVATVDGAALPVCPGPVSARLQADFSSLVAENPDP